MVEYHCYMVNPRELVVSTDFIKNLNSETALNNAPLAKMYILFTQYTNDKVRTQFNGPSVSQFLEGSCLANLCKKPQVVEDLEIMIEDLRNKALPVLQKATQAPLARLQVAHFMDTVIRCILSKPWSAKRPIKLTVGKYTEDKRQQLGYHWANSVELAFPGVENLAKDLGFAEPAGSSKADETGDQELDLQGLAKLKRTDSEPEAPANVFKRGDEVTVLKKMTWHLPTRSDPD